MAEDEQSKDAIHERPTERQPISVAEVFEFMHARKVHLECPECGKNQWGRLPIATDTESLDNISGVALHVIDDKSAIDPIGAYIPMVAMMCRNCGYIRQFMWGMIEDWKRERAKNA